MITLHIGMPFVHILEPVQQTYNYTQLSARAIFLAQADISGMSHRRTAVTYQNPFLTKRGGTLVVGSLSSAIKLRRRAVRASPTGRDHMSLGTRTLEVEPMPGLQLIVHAGSHRGYIRWSITMYYETILTS